MLKEQHECDTHIHCCTKADPPCHNAEDGVVDIK